MQYLPVFMNLHKRDCLVVGGGEVALRKVEALLRANASIYVTAPDLHEGLIELKDQNRIHHQARVFKDKDIDNMALVIAATSDNTVNRAVYDVAHAKNIPVNVVDTPELCDFTFGSIVDRELATISISSSAKSPVLARVIRSIVETTFPAAFAELVRFFESFYQHVEARYSKFDQQLAFWTEVFQGPLAELIIAGNAKVAEKMLLDRLDCSPARQSPKPGEVYLIGAGPGDPDLLTFRALRLLQKADVIFYDRLISKQVLQLAPPAAERFYVGKQRDHHCVPQNEINGALVKYAKQGLTVVRLKGGDPFIFGRGAEEAEALAAAGINFQVVPGITSAAGCGAYAGIPLTHRDYAQSCRFVTGHTKDRQLNLDWPVLATEKETLVFYMGLKNLEQICNKLVEHGLPPAFPVAIIEQGTTDRQRVLVGTLSTITQKAAQEKAKSPSLIIVGKVVKLRNKLGWFESQTGSVMPVFQESTEKTA